MNSRQKVIKIESKVFEGLFTFKSKRLQDVMNYLAKFPTPEYRTIILYLENKRKIEITLTENPNSDSTYIEIKQK